MVEDDFVKGKTVKDIIIDALLTDGGHHKQWYLEQLLWKLGFDVDKLKKELQKEDYEWEEGIAP